MAASPESIAKNAAAPGSRSISCGRSGAPISLVCLLAGNPSESGRPAALIGVTCGKPETAQTRSERFDEEELAVVGPCAGTPTACMSSEGGGPARGAVTGEAEAFAGTRVRDLAAFRKDQDQDQRRGRVFPGLDAMQARG